MAVCSIFSTLSFSVTPADLFEQFKSAESWSDKQSFASTLLAKKNLPHQQRIAIYSDLAELAFNANDLPHALEYYKLLESSITFNELPDSYFRAIKNEGVVLIIKGLYNKLWLIIAGL